MCAFVVLPFPSFYRSFNRSCLLAFFVVADSCDAWHAWCRGVGDDDGDSDGDDDGDDDDSGSAAVRS